MNANAYLQIALFLAVLLALVKPLGAYMAAVYSAQPTTATRVVGPLERLIYRLSGVHADDEMDWQRYALAMLWFNLLGLLAVYALQRLQVWLPFNPAQMPAVGPDSAFNTAVSFATNTNWQGYGGETTMSYLTQMLGLTVQNFVSAASGMAVLIALIRGFVRRETGHIGNFWVDMTRSVLYILLPLSFVLALALVSQGVVQTFRRLQERAAAGAAHRRAAGERRRAASRCWMRRAAGRQADGGDGANHCPRAGGLPDCHQAARHQRRRFLQCQFGASAGEPDAAVEFPRSAGDPADPRCAVLHLRQDGRRHAPGLDGAGGDDGDLRRASRARCGGGAGWQSATGAPRRGPHGIGAAVRRQHGRQGGALRYRQFRTVGHRHHRCLERVGQLDARFLYPARRTGADVAHAVGRSGLRRRGLRAVRHAGVRHHRRLRRRAHGGQDAGVSWARRSSPTR